MKLIPLSQNKYAKVDDEWFDLVTRYGRWYYNDGYAITYRKGRRIRMHRLIMRAKQGQRIDHRNHNTLDNRKANLRFSTLTQNNCNRSKGRNNTSGYIGVVQDPTTGHWRPNIYRRSKAISFGQFGDIHHAALARDLWALNLYGEFACTNFPIVFFGP